VFKEQRVVNPRILFFLNKIKSKHCLWGGGGGNVPYLQIKTDTKVVSFVDIFGHFISSFPFFLVIFLVDDFHVN
jgi:hypothetical protein